jgi:hypothetical protein
MRIQGLQRIMPYYGGSLLTPYSDWTRRYSAILLSDLEFMANRFRRPYPI